MATVGTGPVAEVIDIPAPSVNPVISPVVGAVHSTTPPADTDSTSPVDPIFSLDNVFAAEAYKISPVE